jgi:hypothetical protein
MVGNAHDAANALTGTYVGEGCSRIVYRIGDVVYKVNTTEFNSNLDEYLSGERLRDNVPAPFIVPPMSLYGDVLAMPYYDGTHMGECYCLPHEACSDDCMPESLAVVARSIGCDVSTWGNTMTVGEDIYLIDLGSES